MRLRELFLPVLMLGACESSSVNGGEAAVAGVVVTPTPVKDAGLEAEAGEALPSRSTAVSSSFEARRSPRLETARG